MTDTIIHKIKKLLALGESSNEHEAAAALSRAQELLASHSLTIDEVNGFEMEESISIETDDPLFDGANVALWKQWLASAIAKHVGVYNYTISGRRTKKLALVGKPTAISVFKYMYSYATSELLRLSIKKCKGLGRSYSNSWLTGAVTGINSKLSELTKTEDTNLKMGLVKLNDEYDKAKSFAEGSLKLRKVTQSCSSRINHHAYADGYNTGTALNFAKGSVNKSIQTIGIS